MIVLAYVALWLSLGAGIVFTGVIVSAPLRHMLDEIDRALGDRRPL